MGTIESMLTPLSADRQAHVRNVAENLQLVADLGYGDVTLFVPTDDGLMLVVADARPMTATAAIPFTRVGDTVGADDEPEASAAIAEGITVCGTRRRTRRGISFIGTAYPIGPSDDPYAVVVRLVSETVSEAPGKMELAFMRLAGCVLERMRKGPLHDFDTDGLYSTTRLAGDGVMEVARDGSIEYASPNAVNIMRLAGAEGAIIGSPAAELPGGSSAVAPVLGGDSAREVTVETGGRFLRYRTIALEDSALVLVEDVTDAKRRDLELRVKEATIREVHHRVKNNLQTIASLLRIQARRSTSREVSVALAEAVERVSSMAVVHEMLAESAEESVDMAEALRTVVEMVARGLASKDAQLDLQIDGNAGLVPAEVATPLALVAAELVHNAIEHGVGTRPRGTVRVSLNMMPGELVLTVADDGRGLPAGFSPETSSNLGLAIVHTIVEDDLRGSLSFVSDHGTVVTARVPIADRA